MYQYTAWAESTKPFEEDLRRKFDAEGLSPYAWSNGPGDTYAVHSHSYQKVIYCARGSIRFLLPELNVSVELKPGDRLDLPPGVQHSAIVGPAGVVCLEGHK
jgi:quercetin dioxygenase-like cupin family protein